MRRALAGVLLSLCLGAAVATPARGQELIVDLSQHLVAITTGFTGADVLLFGASGGAEELVVIVRGPDQAATIRRKERLAGIWVNQDRLIFPEVPAFYAVAATTPYAGRDMATMLRRLGIGGEILEPSPSRPEPDMAELAAYREALLRNKQRAGLYGDKIWPITFVGQRLFRTTLQLPANVPTGTYSVTVFSIEDGRIAHMTMTPLIVSKAGFGAAVYAFAHDHAAMYGLIAIAIALMAGWLAGVIFRRV